MKLGRPEGEGHCSQGTYIVVSLVHRLSMSL